MSMVDWGKYIKTGVVLGLSQSNFKDVVGVLLAHVAVQPLDVVLLSETNPRVHDAFKKTHITMVTKENHDARDLTKCIYI